MKRVTIKDIAQLAGVSYATVSRALSGPSEISEQTRLRILELCRREGYRANVLARSLISSKTNVLGLIIPDITNPFYAELSLLIETHAQQLGYHVMLCNTLQSNDATEEIFDFLVGHQVDGILLVNSHNEAREWLRRYCSTVPTVLLGDSISEDGRGQINAVSVDNRLGGRMAVDYLHSLGHERILYFGLRRASITHQTRFESFSAAMEHLGLPLEVFENTRDSSSIDQGYAMAKQLFARGFDGTAIFAATDALALGVLQAADEFGIRVPEDLSLLGFDNIVYTSLPKIMLTTIDQCKSALAEAAVNLLLELMATPNREAYTRRLISPALVERQTCRALPPHTRNAASLN